MTYLLAAICLGLISLFVALRISRQRRLANEGVVVRGRVVRKKLISGEKSESPRGVVRYEFITPKGKYIKRSTPAGEAVMMSCVEGAAIDIVYLKDNPWVSEIKQTVDVNRAALNLPPLSGASLG